VGAEGTFDEHGIAIAAGTRGHRFGPRALVRSSAAATALYWRQGAQDDAHQQNQRVNTPLKVKIQQFLVEARVVLPGAQALFGFQLAIVLTRPFELLPAASKVVHVASLFSRRARRDAFDGSGALSPDRLCRRGH
jgi:hypothetical protein